MQRNSTNKRIVPRNHRRFSGSTHRRVGTSFERGAPTAKSGTALSSKARSLRQPVMVSEDALKKLHLNSPGASRRRGFMGLSPSASMGLIVTLVFLPLIAALAWHSGRFASAESNDNAKQSNSVSTDGLAPTLGVPSEKPSSKTSGNADSVKVGFDQPDLLSVDKLGLNAQIRSLGTNNLNQLMFPGSIYDIGWYNQSALPGGKEMMLLDGYSEGPTKKGALYGIEQLKDGDLVTIKRGDGVRFDYKVSGGQVYYDQTADLKDILKDHPGNKQVLAIVMSQATLSTQSNKPKQSLVVFAELL